MTPVRLRIGRARRRLGFALGGRALLLAFGAGLGVVVLGVLVDAARGLPLLSRAMVPVLAIAIGAGVLLWQYVRRVHAAVVASDETIALWFEARLPDLRYALVTSTDVQLAEATPALEGVVAVAPLEREVGLATRRALTRPAAILAVVLLALLIAPSGAIGRVTRPRPGDALARAGAGARGARDPLSTIVVRVTPPGYAGLPETAHDDPSSIAALAGSRIRIEGTGEGVLAALEGDTLRAIAVGDRWQLSLPLPSRSSAVRLLGPATSRILVLDPLIDSVPVARLEQPTRDTVLRAATGTVTLRAEVRDGLGLADAAFEYIVSSGAGETFTFHSGRVAARRFDAGVRDAVLEGTLVLDTLALGPGDLMHLRAVARDRNDVGGPGLGASETRTLRIARAGEYDSVAVDPMPPTEPEKGVLSQRMILMMTQALEARSGRMDATQRQRESRRIAVDQAALRKRVGEVVFLRLGEDNRGEHSHFTGDGHEHGAEGPLDPDQILAAAERATNVDPTRQLEGEGDETPVVAINRPLLEAYNHMWRASTELETARPGAAIPWMERAIVALQRARAAERIYLRGRPPRVVVDLARVRGTGRDRAAPDPRRARPALDGERASRLRRFDAALSLVAADPTGVADSLLLLRLTVPAADRASAAALDLAAGALGRGGDVTAALQAARRTLAGPPVRRDAVRAWGM